MRVYFEVKHKDLLGRIGRLTLDGKTVETPAFVPVINPIHQLIPASQIKRDFGCNFVITNAYIMFKRLGRDAVERGVHNIIGFDGVVATDSGGYQVLIYGDVDAKPLDIARFQEEIGTDIAIPLDRPTGLSGRREAEKTVEETIANVKSTMAYLGASRRAAWAAPIQGGIYSDLIQRCINEFSKYDFDLYSLGSPTPFMESYLYDRLVSMISTVRQSITSGKPLHLFGAGHPMIFALASALGCDTYDSAAYILFAREDRYMLTEGTFRLDQLAYLPCECRICGSMSLDELKSLEKDERVKALAYHNLSVCFREVNTVKQAIWEGRLFELLERRSKSHPSLYQAFQRMISDQPLMELAERNTPATKRRGLLLFDRQSMYRPELVRALKALDRLDMRRDGYSSAVLIPRRVVTTKSYDAIMHKVRKVTGLDQFSVFTYGTPYGVIPLDLSYTYPFYQTVFHPFLLESLEGWIFQRVTEMLNRCGFRRVVILRWGREAVRGLARRLQAHLSSALEGVEVQVIDV